MLYPDNQSKTHLPRQKVIIERSPAKLVMFNWCSVYGVDIIFVVGK